jgi:predicted RNA binding protein YcfA (HicA-like mRNA interferase family)
LTGRKGKGIMSRKEIAKILKALTAQGFEVKKGGSGHWKIYDADGRMVTVLAATPSDPRSVRNAIAVLRRAGFTWPPR